MKTKIIFMFAILMMTTVVCFAQIRGKTSINLSNLKFEKTQEFAKIEGNFDYWISEEGMPELPVYKVSYVLPIDAEITGITFLSKEKRLLKQGVYIYPVQPPRKVGDTEEIDFIQPNKKVYNSDMPYPGKIYDIESDDIILGYHVVTFRIYPFEYIPQSRILNYYPDLEYTVQYESKRNTDV